MGLQEATNEEGNEATRQQGNQQRLIKMIFAVWQFNVDRPEAGISLPIDFSISPGCLVAFFLKLKNPVESTRGFSMGSICLVRFVSGPGLDQSDNIFLSLIHILTKLLFCSLTTRFASFPCYNAIFFCTIILRRFIRP